MRAGQDGDTLTVRLAGEFDFGCEQRFHDELDEVFGSRPRWLVLDLRGLDFMDSTGLRMLVQLDARSRGAEFQFVVLCADSHVRHVLRESGLDGVLPVVDSHGPVPASDSPV